MVSWSKEVSVGAVLGLVLLLGLQLVMLWGTTAEFLTADAIFYLARPLKSWDELWGLFWRLDDRDNYRPLTYVIATGLYWWAGLDPFPYHVVSILFHLVMTALVFWLSRLLLRSHLGALAAAFFFGLHGTASHVAFDITFLPDVTFGIFFILSLIALLKFEGGKSARWHLASLVFFFLSLLCKEPAVTLPAVAWAALFLVPGLSAQHGGRRLSWKQAFRRTLPFWILAVLYLGWFALLTGGRFSPQDPSHPYHVSLSLSALWSKRLYLKWTFNVRESFGTWADHPEVASALQKLPSSAAEFMQARSDFLLYLFGPAWVVWLTLGGDGRKAAEILTDAFVTPSIVLSLLILACFLLKTARHQDKTAWWGMFCFLAVLWPAMFLPSSKTMIHNLYLPVAGLGVVLGYFLREGWQPLLPGPRRVLAWVVPGALVLAGMQVITRSLHEGWPVTSSWKTENYLRDLQRLHPELPAGTVLYFEKTGDPAWPWFTDAGNLYRLYYRNPGLVTLFGDYGQSVEQASPGQTVIRLRDVNGHLERVGERRSEGGTYRIELLSPESHQWRSETRTWFDRMNYDVLGNELVFRLELTHASYTVVLPQRFRITTCSLPVRLQEEVDGRIAVQVVRSEGAEELLVRARRY